MIRALKQPSALPGFGLTMGYTIFYLSVIVLIPLSAMFIRAGTIGPADLWQVVTAPRVMTACKLTFGASLIAASINAVFGFLVSWVLVRYAFPGKRLVDAMVDLPFALPPPCQASPWSRSILVTAGLGSTSNR
jgi:sulfate transport system permease protein